MYERTLLFLDFDGVLHPQHEGQQVPEDMAFCHLPRLEALLRNFSEVEVVISSTWREQVKLESLKRHFSDDIAARIIGTTPVVNAGNSVLFHRREIEILQWLADSGVTNSRWCALDDAHWQFLHHKENLVACKSYLGFDTDAENRLRGVFTKLRVHRPSRDVAPADANLRK
jgi:hypothetical protein